ncbi:MAG: hypothetical protein HDT14_10430 [Oscillibacter sp.]|nr:hypothetical protein [Oscillibacter sp.]
MEDILIEIRNVIANPNWAAQMSSIAALFTVIFAGLALVVTIKVAQRQNKILEAQTSIAKEQTEISKKQAEIAEQQNKIAVFDKQFELYDITNKCLQFSKGLSLSIGVSPKAVTLSNIRLAFLGVFSDMYVAPETLENSKQTFYFQETYKIRTKLCQAEFIFSEDGSEDIGEHLIALANCLSYLICADTFMNSGISLEILMMNYCSTAEKIETEGILQKMKKELYSKNTAVSE